MRKKLISALSVFLAAITIAVGFCDTAIQATNVANVLPASGVALALEDGLALQDLYEESLVASENGVISENDSEGSVSSQVAEDGEATVSANGAASAATIAGNIVAAAEISGEVKDVMEAEAQENNDPENFSNLVIAQVYDYVNVRDIPSEEGEILGKLYDDSVGNFIEEENGWYLITSGSVTGYVKAEYCVTGEEAIALAEEVGERIATVTTTTLKVRTEPTTESEVLGLVPIEEELSVLEELDGWVRVSIEEGEGYVSTDYVELRTDFVTAESREEEEARLARERQAQLEAQAAAEAASRAAQASGNTEYAIPVITGDSSLGVAVAEYACQFVGNPYVYGGTSLTNGADCSGFVMSVYAAFGVSLPHSSAADRNQGYAVEGGLENAQPGDLICYSGHVALYIGNGQIVHASTSRTGIIISSASYRNILAIRRIF